MPTEMHFSFSAVNENADENEIPFSAEKRKRRSRTCAYITELSYGSVANITFSAGPTQMRFFGSKTKTKTKMDIHFRLKTKKKRK